MFMINLLKLQKFLEIYSFIWQIFIEYLVWAKTGLGKNYSGHYATTEQK